MSTDNDALDRVTARLTGGIQTQLFDDKGELIPGSIKSWPGTYFYWAQKEHTFMFKPQSPVTVSGIEFRLNNKALHRLNFITPTSVDSVGTTVNCVFTPWHPVI